MQTSKPRIDGFLTVFTLAAVLVTVAGMTLWPGQAAAVASQLFSWSTRSFGSLVQIFVFGCVVACVALAFSKYGNVRLGEGKPEYSTLSWVFLLLLRGEAEGLLAATRMIEAAAGDIDGRPVLGGADWRADMALVDNAEWTTGHGPAVGLRLRAALA